jgi:hypothetical protein
VVTSSGFLGTGSRLTVDAVNLGVYGTLGVFVAQGVLTVEYPDALAGAVDAPLRAAIKGLNPAPGSLGVESYVGGKAIT